MVSVSVNGRRFDHASVEGRMVDTTWDSRATKSITINGVALQEVVDSFVDGVVWSIIVTEVRDIPVVDEQGHAQTDENGELLVKTVTQTEEYDNSEYSKRGDISIHPDGSITVKMGKPTNGEMLAELMEVMNIEEI